MAGLSEEKKQSLKRPRSDAEEHNDDAAEVKQAAPKDPPKILTPEEEAKALAAMDFSEEKKAAVLRGSHYRTLSDGELWSLAPGDLSDAEAALELKKARQLDNPAGAAAAAALGPAARADHVEVGRPKLERLRRLRAARAAVQAAAERQKAAEKEMQPTKEELKQSMEELAALTEERRRQDLLEREGKERKDQELIENLLAEIEQEENQSEDEEDEDLEYGGVSILQK